MNNDEYILEQIERIHMEVAQNIAQFDQLNIDNIEQQQQQNQQLMDQQQMIIQQQNQQLIDQHLQFQQQMFIMNPFGF